MPRHPFTWLGAGLARRFGCPAMFARFQLVWVDGPCPRDVGVWLRELGYTDISQGQCRTFAGTGRNGRVASFRLVRDLTAAHVALYLLRCAADPGDPADLEPGAPGTASEQVAVSLITDRLPAGPLCGTTAVQVVSSVIADLGGSRHLLEACDAIALSS
jgi:hypothetical protein